MIEFHMLDEQNIYVGTVTVDPQQSLPGRGVVAQDPPRHSSSEVAVWRGDGWEVIDLKEVTPTKNSHVPQSCTRRQGRLALLQSGLIDDAESIISGIADPTERRAAQIEYDADTWERDNEFLQQMWALLDGTPETLDDLFRLAVTL